MNDYTPLFFPAFGWAFIIVAVGAGLSELTGSADKAVRRSVKDSAPFHVLTTLRVAFVLALIVSGTGILRSSESVAKIGLIPGALVLVLHFVLTKVFEKKPSQ